MKSQVIILVLFILVLSFIITYLIYLNNNNIVFFSVISLAFSCCVYGMASAVLLAMDRYSIIYALTLCLLVNTIVTIILIIKNKVEFRKLKFEIKDSLFLIICFVVIVYLAFPTSGLCGLWRDDGGYQMKALNFLNGNYNNPLTLSLNENLSDEELDWYKGSIEDNLRLLWNYNSVHDGLFKEYSNEFSLTRIYNNVPTFPSYLALFGILFGTSNMQFCQILFLLIAVMTVFYIFENFKLPLPIEILGVSIILLSPQVIYFLHTAFVELFLITMVFLFCFGLLDCDKSGWIIVMAVGGFSVMHVSAYCFIPIVAVCIWIQAISCRNKRLLLLVDMSIIAYIIGFVYMSLYNKYYVFANYQLLTKYATFITSYERLCAAVFFACLVAFIVNGLLRRFIANIRFGNANWFFAFLTIFIGYLSLKKGISMLSIPAESKISINILYKSQIK